MKLRSRPSSECSIQHTVRRMYVRSPCPFRCTSSARMPEPSSNSFSRSERTETKYGIKYALCIMYQLDEVSLRSSKVIFLITRSDAQLSAMLCSSFSNTNRNLRRLSRLIQLRHASRVYKFILLSDSRI